MSPPPSPEPMCSPPYPDPLGEPSIAQAGAPFATSGIASYGEGSRGPTTTPLIFGQRKNSASSAFSACFSDDDPARRLSISSFGSSSDLAGSSSPGSSWAERDKLPPFRLQPADLATMGLLQLKCMGAQHPGAAQAAYLLRTGDSPIVMPGFVHFPPEPLANSMPIPPSAQDAQDGLMTGFGPGGVSGTDYNYELAFASGVPGSASVPGVGFGDPVQIVGVPPEVSNSEPGGAAGAPGSLELVEWRKGLGSYGYITKRNGGLS